MISELLDIYSIKLQRYFQQEEDEATRVYIKNLLKELKTTTSISALSETLATFLKSDHVTNSQLAKDIKDWINYLDELQTLEISVLEKLPKLNFVGNTQPLKNILQQIVSREDYLFHCRAKSLLVYLSNNALQATLNYLADLSPNDSAATSIAAMGAFKQANFFSKEHADCVQLLTKNSVNFIEQNKEQTLANDILQTALFIYQDINREAKLQQTSHDAEPSRGCIMI
ncbi:hypothetical protein [Legionella hackeliae]|nr:hypothetical protein [Legionella hackeliae]KTD14834.1 hypothetical protein Lhac_0364 [Legionella hackeliae]